MASILGAVGEMLSGGDPENCWGLWPEVEEAAVVMERMLNAGDAERGFEAEFVEAELAELEVEREWAGKKACEYGADGGRVA